jgi:hypothetical protein
MVELGVGGKLTLTRTQRLQDKKTWNTLKSLTCGSVVLNAVMAFHGIFWRAEWLLTAHTLDVFLPDLSLPGSRGLVRRRPCRGHRGRVPLRPSRRGSRPAGDSLAGVGTEALRCAVCGKRQLDGCLCPLRALWAATRQTWSQPARGCGQGGARPGPTSFCKQTSAADRRFRTFRVRWYVKCERRYL